MSGSPSLAHVWIIGPGRLGLSLGWQLLESGALTRLSISGRQDEPPRHPLFDDHRAEFRARGAPEQTPAAVIICVPDDAIVTAAELIAASPSPPPVVLHTSGVLESDVLLSTLSPESAAGSFHPLVAIPDSNTGAEKLKGAWYGIEGSPKAVDFATRIAAAFAGRTLQVPAGGKSLYHAGAVFASNFVVSLLDVGLRLFRRAGIADDVALAALASLAEGSVRDAARTGPVAALTGPITRGDAGTVARHLDRLSEEELTLYSVLALEALKIASARGLDEQAVRRIHGMLEGGRA